MAPTWKIRASRALNRAVTGRESMFCTEIHRRRHWAERWLDVLFRPWGRGHCADCSAWESEQQREPDVVNEWRKEGWL